MLEETTMRPTTLFHLIFILLLSLSCPIHAQPEIEWARNYEIGYQDYFWSLIETEEGQIMCAGYTTSEDGYYKYGLLLCLDNQGDSLWSQVYPHRYCVCYSLIQIDQGGFVMSGLIDTNQGGWDGMLLSVNENGDSLWSKSYGSQGPEIFHTVFQLDNNRFALIGNLYIETGDEYWLLITDDQGDSLNSYTYDGGDSFCKSAIQLENSNLILFGECDYYRNKGGTIICVEDDGDSLWSIASSELEFLTAAESPNGDLAFGGYTESNYGFVTLVEYEGDSLWYQEFDELRRVIDVLVQDDGSFIVFGQSNDDLGEYYLIRINSEGERIWSYLLEFDVNTYLTNCIQSSDGGIILAGYTCFYDEDNVSDVFVAKISLRNVTTSPSSLRPHPSSMILYPAFPNPFNSSTTIQYALPSPGEVTLSIYNPIGQLIGTVFKGYQLPGSYSTTFNGNQLSSGLYFVKLKSGEEMLTRKLMLVR